MTERSILLLGGPDSGKTNYLGRLWPSFKKRKGVLRAEALPSNIHYVDSAVQHLMLGDFAPRSDRNLEVGRGDFIVEVRGGNGAGEPTSLLVPDISGELWTKAVKSSEIAEEWLDLLKSSAGTVLFVRAHSDQNVKPLDWVTARTILRLEMEDDDEGNPSDEPPAEVAEAMTDGPSTEGTVSGDDAQVEMAEDAGIVEVLDPDLPTQVLLCELLRYLDLYLMDRSSTHGPRVAVVIAAWDMLDAAAREAGPMAYLKREFPLFAGRLSEPGRLDVRLFGLSIVGGDLTNDPDFKKTYMEGNICDQGWVVVESGDSLASYDDVMLPVAWAMGD